MKEKDDRILSGSNSGTISNSGVINNHCVATTTGNPVNNIGSGKVNNSCP